MITATNRSRPVCTGSVRLYCHLGKMLTGLGCGYSARRPNNRTGPSNTSPSVLFFLIILFFSIPFCCVCTFRLRTILPFPSFSSFQPSTLGSNPTPVSSDLALYYFRYCSAITPISPTPSHPDLLLYSVSYLSFSVPTLLFRYV